MGRRRQKLSDDIYLLGDLLGDVIRSQAGSEAFALEEHVARAGQGIPGRQRRGGD